MPNSKDSEIVFDLYKLQTKLLKRLDQALMVHGISVTEFMVMHHLNNCVNSNMRRIDLAERIGLSASGVTRLLNPMQKIGLVQKEESVRDARVSLVTLTNTGQALYNDAQKSYEQFADSYLSALTKQQTAALTGIIQKLL